MKKGPPPGLIAFHENKPVGWCQLTQRNSLAWFEKVYPGAIAQEDALIISCFYVRRGFKRKGVSTALIHEAIHYANRVNCKVIESFPQDSASSFTGHKSSFLKAGFKTVERVKLNRTFMRLQLK